MTEGKLRISKNCEIVHNFSIITITALMPPQRVNDGMSIRSWQCACSWNTAHVDRPYKTRNGDEYEEVLDPTAEASLDLEPKVSCGYPA